MNSGPNNSVVKELNPLQKALRDCYAAFRVIFAFAFCINILMLITPLYSLQVLDRVIGSGNLNTLTMLTLIVTLIYFVYGLLQIARSYTMIRIGEWLDNNLSPVLLSHSIAHSAIKQSSQSGQLQRDFQTVKTFLTSTGLNTILDAPWSIAYIIVIFLIHPYIGYLTVIGAILIIILAFLNAIATNKTLSEGNEYSIRSMHQAEIAGRNAEAIEAMGMMDNVVTNWQVFNQRALEKQSEASYRNGAISNVARFLRNIMQVLVTCIGAYLVVSSKGEAMTTGNMIACSIMVGRALAPFDNAIELWKTISTASKSYKKITDTFATSTLRDSGMPPVSKVTGSLVVENIHYAHQPKQAPNMPFMAPQEPQYVLNGISFELKPGEILAIIGPSAAGKSTLAKVITGVWPATKGSVRLDGGDIYKWNRKDLGKHLGYLPQGIELFSGTVKQNIARMAENIDSELVEEAARLSGAHDIILKFNDGYDSDIGIAGYSLSGGQRQRIGLARAFYGNPKLVVLDEPNSNLDEAGEKALSKALQEARKKNISVIVISHRPSILSVVDKILIVKDGKSAGFGDRKEIMKKLQLQNDGMIHLQNNNEDN
ncbi:MAG: type I secretion system permease/ATPase [Rickettsiaceae bacterium]|nr:type I secretion system permease/ATPase [Rickettsiaceae bacterium]